MKTCLVFRRFVSHRFIHSVGRWIVPLGLVYDAASAPIQPVDLAYLATLRAEVRAAHPGVAGAQARAAAAEATVRAVRRWDDPTAGVAGRLASSERRGGEGEFAFSGEQGLPQPGLYAARRHEAKAGVAMAMAEIGTAALAAEVRVIKTTVALALTDESMALGAQQLAWLVQQESVTRVSLGDPQSTAVPLLRMGAELARDRQRLASLTPQRLGLVGQLNTLLGRPLGAEWPELALPDQVTEPTANELIELLARLPLANPRLLALKGSSAAALAGVEVAQRVRQPRFALTAETWTIGEQRHVDTVLGARMSLPWGQRAVYRAQVDRARELARGVALDFQSLERDLRGEVVAIHAAVSVAAQKSLNLRAGVIPRLAEASKALDNAWLSSRVSLLEILEARRALLAALLDQRSAVADYASAQESLRALVPPLNANLVPLRPPPSP